MDWRAQLPLSRPDQIPQISIPLGFSAQIIRRILPNSFPCERNIPTLALLTLSWKLSESCYSAMAATMTSSQNQASVYPKSHVGFDSITSQIEKKLLKRGFQFNIICVGEFHSWECSESLPTVCAGQTGLGKSTLINTIFASHLMDSKGRMGPEEAIRSTTEIQAVSHIIEENGVRLRLNIVRHAWNTAIWSTTTAAGTQLWNTSRINTVHICARSLLLSVRRYLQDTRIHCCLFFIQPSGHALKPIDIVVLKKLSGSVNVVPVIAKSDSLTLEERAAFKERIKEEFAFHNLRMYPYDNEEHDQEEVAFNAQIKVRDEKSKQIEPFIYFSCDRTSIPFAIVGSEKTIIVGGKQVRGRQNRWGVINGTLSKSWNKLIGISVDPRE